MHLMSCCNLKKNIIKSHKEAIFCHIHHQIRKSKCDEYTLIKAKDIM